MKNNYKTNLNKKNEIYDNEPKEKVTIKKKEKRDYRNLSEDDQ